MEVSVLKQAALIYARCEGHSDQRGPLPHISAARAPGVARPTCCSNSARRPDRPAARPAAPAVVATHVDAGAGMARGR